ncbi:MAG: hypothetical protein VR75_04880 [Hyphomonadaceae bacterium BRH_c29]|nr:MAG: hypothetical protein VR75_04880 [Hyphomonadaceae bacterium BRH_c29]
MHNPGTTEAAVDLLAVFALPGRTLELAIGTGRVALPLAARGCRIEGIEASPDMVAKLREKPGGADIPVTLGDMAVVKAEGEFDFIFLIFNTLFNLTSQAAQVACFRNAASMLALEASIHDPTTQRIDYQVLRITKNGFQLTPLPMRYAWPQETDLMAELAGLSLENRWGGWDKSAFTADSRTHISVYRKPTA